MFFIRVMKTG